MSRSLRERGAHAVPKPRMQAARATLLAESDSSLLKWTPPLQTESPTATFGPELLSSQLWSDHSPLLIMKYAAVLQVLISAQLCFF